MKCLLKILLLSTMITGIVSCSSPLPTNYYLIKTDPAVTKAEKAIPLKIDVNPVRAPDRYRGRIVYRRGEYEVGFYENSQWIEVPSDMVRRALINALNESGLFARVDIIGSDPATELDLKSEIVSFDQVIEGEDYYAEFALILEFVRSDTGGPVWSYRAQARVKQKGEGAFPAAMSEAVSEAISGAVAEMEKSEELQALPAELSDKKKAIGKSGDQ